MNNEEFATRLDEIAKELEQLCEVAPTLEFHVEDARFHADQLSYLAVKVRRLSTLELPDFEAMGYRAYWEGKPIQPGSNPEKVDKYTFTMFSTKREYEESHVAYTEGWCRAQDEHRERSVKARLKKRETPFRFLPNGRMTALPA